jgi:ribosomal-protein-serine acetyltransferase
MTSGVAVNSRGHFDTEPVNAVADMKKGADRVLRRYMETQRLYLRAYKAGDGPMYYAASMRNRGHLAEFESDNVMMHLKSKDHAEMVVRELAADWMAGSCFFIGIFDKANGEWCGQVYVGPTNWESLEFTIGFVADVHCEGKGYISEAVNGVLEMLFEDLNAYLIKSECSENNIRSRRLLDRCGFRREGYVQEQGANADGSTNRDCLYVLSQKEYLNR